MSWIALKMLTGDKAKFFGIVLGLTFAALLITQQGSIFCGIMCRTAGQIYDLTGADLWVMDGNVRYIDDVKPMVENNLYRVRGIEGVKWAVPLYKGNARAKINSGQADEDGNPVFRDDPADPDKEPSQYFMLADKRTGRPSPDAMGHPVFTDKGRKKRFHVLTNGRNVPLPHGVGGFLVVDASDRLRRPIPIRPVRHEVIEQVVLLGLDDASLVGAPPVGRMLAGDLKGLNRPDAVVVDFTRLQKLFPGDAWWLGKVKPHKPYVHVVRDGRGRTLREEVYGYDRYLGRELEMNDHRAVIVGVCEATRTFQSNAVVYTKYSRAKNFAPQERKVLSYVLAKADVKVPASIEDPKAIKAETERQIQEVARRISARTGLWARTSQQFIWDTIWYYFKYTGIPLNFGITAALGFLVGTAIAGQTFYNFTLDNIKQFGALKAMGATNLRIVAMILLQATVVGLLGYGLGVALAELFGILSQGGELAFYTPIELLPITGGAVVLICILSSVLSVRRVIVLEPAVVFRG